LLTFENSDRLTARPRKEILAIAAIPDSVSAVGGVPDSVVQITAAETVAFF